MLTFEQESNIHQSSCYTVTFSKQCFKKNVKKVSVDATGYRVSKQVLDIDSGPKVSKRHKRRKNS